MRIVSLLPSLTELVVALGHGSELVGVTHECDFPVGIERLPHLTRSRIPTAATSTEIDSLVAAQGGSLYDLDITLLEQLEPDLILTQEQCDVCAVNEATVRRAAGALASKPHVESVNPTDLAGVFGMFRQVAALLSAEAEVACEQIISGFLATWAEIAGRLLQARATPKRVILLEWFDPPYASGHWNPDLIERAGGTEVLAHSGDRSRRVTWEGMASAAPEVIVLAPCGFALDRAREELPALLERPEWSPFLGTTTVLVDGSAYFSRPGPRLETSLRIAAAAIHPELCHDLAPVEGEGWARIA